MKIKTFNGSITKAERETILIYSENDACWYADTSVGKHIRKFEKQGWTCEEQTLNKSGSIIAAQFKAPAHAVLIRSSKKIKRELSEEQKEAARIRLQKARNKAIKN